MSGQRGLWALHHLRFTPAGEKRLQDVSAFLDRLEATEHPLASRARGELTQRMLYLDSYGGPVSDVDGRRRFEVTVGADLYLLSFTVTWKMLDRDTGEYVYSMNGGLVWHGGPTDGGSVCLEPGVLWGIHT